MDCDSYTPGRKPWNDFDDLFADLILAIPDGELLGLPHDISMEELVRRFPEVYEKVRQQQQPL